MCKNIPVSWYNASCTVCPRLRQFLLEVKQVYPDYFCRPVPPFGDIQAELLVVGLAPGKHGANASGRPFTGDHAGGLLYQTLYKYGFASGPESKHAQDDLQLKNCRITNAVKCLPPQNKPIGKEAQNCTHFIRAELGADNLKVVLTLGQLAHRAVLRSFGYSQRAYKFAHNAKHVLPNQLRMVNSYHCSRYNTQTKRLTESMFHDVFEMIVDLLAEH